MKMNSLVDRALHPGALPRLAGRRAGRAQRARDLLPAARASPGVSENIRGRLGRRPLPRALADLRLRARRRDAGLHRLGRPDAAQPRQPRRAGRRRSRTPSAARRAARRARPLASPTTPTPGSSAPDGDWTRRAAPTASRRNVQRELIERHAERAASGAAVEPPSSSAWRATLDGDGDAPRRARLLARGGRARRDGRCPPLRGRAQRRRGRSSAAATPGCGRRGGSSSSSPEARVVLLEAERCGYGPSGRNGGFVNAMWFSLPTLRAALRRRGRARGGPSRRSDSVTEIGRWCEEQGVDAWFTPGGYLQVSTAPRLRRRLGRGRRGLRASSASRRHASSLDREPRSGAAATRRSSAAAPSTRRRRPCSRRASPHGLRDRVLERRGRDLRAHAGRVGCADRGGERASPSTERGGVRAPARGARRRRRRCSRLPAAAPPADRDLEPHGDHRAGPRRARGDRLDRRRVHHRLAGDDPLLPDHARRADRLRLGRRPDRPRRPDCTAAPSVDPGGRRRGRAPPASASSRRSRARRIEHAWGGPIDVSPTHLPVIRSSSPGSTARLRLHRPRGRALAHGRPLARLAGARPPRRGEPARRSSTRRRVRVPPEPFRYVGGTIDPARDPAQGGGARARPPARPADPGGRRDPGADRHPHRALS